ncbi:hypothetical protein B0T14DRAFT_497047 [Immersiella caudata]|uniref:Myb-like domain-containing protein n=1 Tax=Immersiella caudata TaxID=314043 RepID=A0AA39WS18_9PEZI|nr:hypothetical protein B0T14DRAFT_497047 [Immersiella caudata]
MDTNNMNNSNENASNGNGNGNGNNAANNQAGPSNTTRPEGPPTSCNPHTRLPNGRMPLPGHDLPPGYTVSSQRNPTTMSASGPAPGNNKNTNNTNQARPGPATATTGPRSRPVVQTPSSWTEEEILLMFRMKREGRTYREIAERVPRHTRDAVVTQYLRLRRTRPEFARGGGGGGGG